MVAPRGVEFFGGTGASIAMRVTDGRPYKQGEQRLCGRYLIDPLSTQQRDDRLRQLRQTFIFGRRNRLFA